MQNRLFRKCLVVGIIILFIGAGFLPIISGTKELKTTNDNEFVEYIRFDDFEDYYVGEPPKSERGWTTKGVNSNQFIEARVDPLNPDNMAMLIRGSSSNPDTYCRLCQEDFGPADSYIIHYRIYTPDLSMSHTVYEKLIEDDTGLVNIHRRTGQIRWGSDSWCGRYYEFSPRVEPSTTRWIEEEVLVTPCMLRLFHDNSINAFGGFCNIPVNGISSWRITGYREVTQDFYIDDFWITEYESVNQPPEKPIITGPKSGKPRVLLTFNIVSEDPDGNDIYYLVWWGDGHYIPYTGPYASGEEATFSHAWSNGGEYTIAVKAKDLCGAKSPQSSFKLSITKTRAMNTTFLNFLQNHPNLFPILRHLLRL